MRVVPGNVWECWWENQLNCAGGEINWAVRKDCPFPSLQCPEQTLEQFPRGDTNASCTESLPSAKRAANSRWVDQAWRREL